MPIENDSEEVVGLALLKLGAAPDGSQRGNMVTLGAVFCPHAQNHRAFSLLD